MSVRSAHALAQDLYLRTVSPRGAVLAFVLFWSVVVVFPLCLLFIYSFLEVRYFQIVWEPSLATWTSVFDSGRWITAVRTLRIALTVTVIELLIGFPFALWLAKGCTSGRIKAFVLTLLTIPFFLDLSSRIIVLRPLLSEDGMINTILLGLGLIAEPVRWLLYSEFAVHLGMIAPYFPTMVLPIFLVMTFIDDEYLQASADLGAGPFQTLVHVIIPLALPGVIAGVVFTLGPALAVYVEPAMLGGGFVNMLSQSVESAYTALNYPVVAALSTLVILLLAVLLIVLVLLSRRYTALDNVFVVLRQ
jgi:spermidine/putrescine transport system permease protein